MPLNPRFETADKHWAEFAKVSVTSYRCGFCGDQVSSEKGISYLRKGSSTVLGPGILICPQCKAPTFVYPVKGDLFPTASFGNPVAHLPKEINDLFEEARSCTSGNNFTAAVLVCRKILMHIAVAQGAAPNKSFLDYVDYLASSGYVPPNGRHWVDHIRKKGNEANHEITVMSSQDAKELITFLEMLLRFIYEFPNSIPKPKEQTK